MMPSTSLHSTPLFFHGKEGTNQGNKARWLAREYGACTPSYETHTLAAALPLARQVLAEHRPTAIVGSSFGGAVLLSLVQEELWDGPSVFLAQAGVKFGLPAKLPAGLPAVLIHGTGDDCVSLDDSRRLAASSGARLVEIDDGHRLSSIRESGLLDSVLKSLGVVPLLEGTERPETPRSVRLDWLSEFLALDTSPERRAELAAAPLVTGREAIAPVTAALRGTWRQVDTPAAVAAKQAISQFLVEAGSGHSPTD